MPTLTVLLAVVAYVAFIGGLRSGLFSAAILSMYGLYYFSSPGQIFHYTDANILRLVILPVTLVIVALLVGILRRALAESEARLRRQLDFSRAIDRSLGEGVYALDRKGQVTFVNPAAERMLGWTEAELLGKVMHDVIHFQHADGTAYPREECTGLEVLRSGASYRNDDDVFTRKDGSMFPVAYSSGPIIDDGQIQGVVVAFRDMTERKRAEQALRESEAKLRLITEQLPAIVWTTDFTLRVTSISGTALESLGREPGAYLGKTFYELLGSEDRASPPIAAHLRALQGEPTGYERVSEDRIFEARLEPLRDEQNRIVGCLGLALDVTQRKQAEQALRRSEERFRSLVQNASDTITVIQADGTIIYQSPSIERVLGYPPESLVGENFFDRVPVHPADLPKTNDLLAELLRSADASVTAELRLRHVDGSWRYVEATAKNLLHDPAVGGIVSNYHDVTDARRAAQRLSTQYEVSRILAEAANLDEATPKILQAISECLDWDYGALWTVDWNDQVLRCVANWHNTSMRLQELEALNRSLTFARGVGLPGRVWASGEPEWIVDAAVEVNFPRLSVAASEGLHGGFGLPIKIGRRVVGVIEFFSHEIRAADQELLDMTAAMGSQIGQFIERKEAEAAMRESEARKAAILESALDAIITIDHAGSIVEFNPAAEKTFGYTRAAVIGTELAGLILPPSMRERHRRGLAHYLATGEGRVLNQRLEASAVRADGTEFPVELVITPIHVDGLPMFTGYIHDITERSRTRDALAARVRQQAAVAQLGRQALATPDVPKLMDEIVGLVAQTLGVEYCKILELLPEGNALRLRAGVGWKEGYVGHATVGTELDSQAGYTLFSGAPVIVEDLRTETRFSGPVLLREHGVVSGMSVIIHGSDRTFGVLGAHTTRRRAFTRDDIHFLQAVANVLTTAIERKAFEEQLALERDEAERLEELDRLRNEFISSISHDLRTPLTAARAGLGMLKTKLSDRLLPKEQHLMDNIRRNIERLRMLIDDLLTLNQFEAGALQLDREPLDLRTVVADSLASVHTLVEQKGQTLEVDLPEPLETVGDTRRLIQVVVNVLGNAHYHTPPGTRIMVSGQVDSSEVVLTVSDNGPGIPAEELDAIFQRFHRLSSTDGGSGLGLSIVRGIVELHGGRIWVESELGEGTTFHIALPCYQNGVQP